MIGFVKRIPYPKTFPKKRKIVFGYSKKCVSAWPPFGTKCKKRRDRENYIANVQK